MAQVTLPYTLTPGTPENVNNLMSNLTALRDGVNTIDTAQLASDSVTAAKIAASAVGSSEIATNAVTADKLAAALANNLGVNQTGVTNRAAMTAMTTERTTTSTTFADVTGATMDFTVASGGYVIVGWNCQLKHDTSSVAYVKVLADTAICNSFFGPGASPGVSASVGNFNTYYKIGAMAMFSAAELGTGSKTFKFQFALSTTGTARINNCYMTVTQVTF